MFAVMDGGEEVHEEEAVNENEDEKIVTVQMIQERTQERKKKIAESMTRGKSFLPLRN